MRIESVRAGAFGALNGAVMDLAPGLTVVLGPNESGKSTWQSAISALICGRRRGPGVTEEERAFERSFRPWSGDTWEVGGRIVLDDGTRIEIHRDLGANSSSVKDVDLGTDLASDLIFDGAPDVSLLLGLNRLLFRTTASVRQAELQQLQDDRTTAAMQTQLQRVADTAGTSDTNATQALQLIEKFRQEGVGTTRSNAIRPLRKAMNARARAAEDLAAAKSAHDEYLRLAAEAELAADAANRARVNAEQAEAVLDQFARESARAERHAKAKLRLNNAEQAHARLTQRIEELRNRISRQEELQDALSAVGESSVPAAAIELGERVKDLTARRSAVGESRPAASADPEVLAVAAAGVAEVRATISRFEVLKEPPAPDDSEVAAARAAAAGPGPEPEDPSRPNARRTLIAGGGVVVLAAVALAGSGRVMLGALLLLPAVGLLVAGALAGRGWRQPAASDVAAQAALAAAVERLRFAREQHDAWIRNRDELVAWCSVRDLPADPDALRQLVVAAEQLERVRPLQSRWDQLTTELEGATEELRALLVGYGRSAAVDVISELGLLVSIAQANRVERTQLETQLAGLDGDPASWSAELAALEEQLPDVAAEFAAATLPDESPGVLEPERTLDDVRAEAEAARREAVDTAADANGLEGQLAERQRNLPSVAAAEETLAAAEDELSRIRRLDEILVATQQFITRAQQDHYRDIAPVLVRTLEPRLPALTAGRYVRATVVPADLRVEVADAFGQLRPVEYLSLGTREQAYLLLRIGLTEVLTRGLETCPLIFDDITVHADPERKAAMLAMVHELSRDRQVVLFSQEQAVRDWAVDELDPALDRCIELARPAGGSPS